MTKLVLGAQASQQPMNRNIETMKKIIFDNRRTAADIDRLMPSNFSGCFRQET